MNANVSLAEITELRKFGNKILGYKTINEIADELFEKIYENIHPQVCSIFLISKNGYLERIRISGKDQFGSIIENDWLPEESYSLGESFSGKAAAPSGSFNSPYGDPHLSTNLDQEIDKLTNGREYAEKLGFLKTGISVPMNGTSRTFGTIEVINKIDITTGKPDPKLDFSEKELCWLTIVGAHVSGAIYRLRKLQEEKVYASISRTLADPKNLKTPQGTVYKTVTDSLINDLLPYKVCILRKLEGRNGLVIVEESHTPDIDMHSKGKPVRYIEENGLISKAFRDLKHEVVEDIENNINKFVSQSWIEEQKLKSFICFPLVVQKTAVGVISLYTGYKRSFNETDIEFLENVSYLLAAYIVGLKEATEAKKLNEIEAERKVEEAFYDKRWDFRTVEGISRQTGLSALQVKEIVENFERKNFVRKSIARDRKGRELYCLSSKPVSLRESLAAWRILISKSSIWNVSK